MVKATATQLHIYDDTIEVVSSNIFTIITY